MFESNVIALPSPFALGRTVVGIRGVLSSPSDEIYAPFIGVIQTGGNHHRRAGHGRCFHVSCRLAVSEARLALPNFYKITIRIANVAVRLAVRVLWLCDKLGSSIPP
jgi:hypothetical protein